MYVIFLKNYYFKKNFTNVWISENNSYINLDLPFGLIMNLSPNIRKGFFAYAAKKKSND